MRNRRRLFLVLSAVALVMISIGVFGWSVLAKVMYNAKDLAGPPPASLDQYFPPNGPPTYLLEMFNMAGPFEAIGVHTQEGDMAYVKPSFDAFKAQYDKVSQMVPEWRKGFPEDPVEALGSAIDGGNPLKIGQAMGAVGQVCSDCHLVFQVKVQQKYHWRDFDTVTLIDPVTSANITFGDYMTAMAGSFEGALADLSIPANLTKAQNNVLAFDARFDELAKDGCKQCHTDPVTQKEIPRAYYADPASLGMIDQMVKDFGVGGPLNPPAAGALSGGIGNNICFNCHLVHMPAQTTKDIWSQFSQILK